MATFPVEEEKNLDAAIQAVAALDRRIVSLTTELKAIDQRVLSWNKRISREFGGMNSFTGEDLDDIARLMKSFQKERSAFAEVRGAYVTEKERIIQEGYRPETYPELKEKIGGLTEEEWSLASRHQENHGIKKNQLRSIQKDLRLHEQ